MNSHIKNQDNYWSYLKRCVQHIILQKLAQPMDEYTDDAQQCRLFPHM